MLHAGAPSQALAKTSTPGKSRCEDVAELLKLSAEPETVKSIVLAAEKTDEHGHPANAEIWLLLLRGDHDLNEIKASKVPGPGQGFRFATEGEIVEHFGCKPGYLGPIGLKKPVKIVADRTVANMSDFVSGANEVDFHYTGMNWGRDLPEPDISSPISVTSSLAILRRTAKARSPFSAVSKSATCSISALSIPTPMKATFLDENGKPQPLEMGCYGIGVTRLCWVRPSSRITTTRASSGRMPLRRLPW